MGWARPFRVRFDVQVLANSLRSAAMRAYGGVAGHRTSGPASDRGVCGVCGAGGAELVQFFL